ncbi:hypothetical protein [Campylobacter sp. CNRCH_2015_0338h]|uniref:hypothetical protein n=1 Tax=Campylobacter sp. CNRCH_2015_0338h TaxID=2911605 RepID=UPI0021E6D17B|nr:hypothetical protein [Campylobacter sp. CNRCH_2015_0338h]MCV3471837.1 hypothetical protein [Campylobacter sp. CNRCH_2015_0338h]
MVSLAELKTGKEKLELINQILLRIDTIARALDNTRLDEIVGLKESVNSLHEQTLELKQEVLTMYTSFSENKKDFDTKFSSVNEKFSIMQERFSFIEQAYNDFSSSKEELELIKGFIEENKPVFESLKDDLSKYESMKIDLEAIITEATNNTKLSKEYFELSSKIKDDILRELEHCKDLVQELNYSADELRGLKPELLQIKKEVNELSSQASKVVLDASEIIKNKINTIFFENQRLNQEMIDSVKKLEEIKYDVGIKYKEIIQAYNLLLETKESLEELKEVIALYEEFENDIKSYSELIKNFKEQIANLESDLENKAQGLHEALEAKGEQVISSIETAKNEAIVKFDELVAKCEGYKIHFEQSYDRFNQRALIANEDLGRLAEVAKKELGNDKLIYETELKALRDSTIEAMNDIYQKMCDDATGIVSNIEERESNFREYIETSKTLIDNLTQIFITTYQGYKNEFDVFVNNHLQNLHTQKEEYKQELDVKKEEYKQELDVKKDECLEEIDAKAIDYDIVSIKEDVVNLKPRVEALEFDKVNKDAKIDILENAINTNTQKIEQTKEELLENVETTEQKLQKEITNINEQLKTKVSIEGNKTINGNITLSGALTANGTTNLNGNTTFKLIPNCAVNPTADNHLARKWYVDYGGGIKNLGTVGSTNIDLRQAQHFILTANANTELGIANWGGAGKSGTITINNCQNIKSFKAPFKFRIAQSGFSGTETFAYFCIAANNIRLVRS